MFFKTISPAIRCNLFVFKEKTKRISTSIGASQDFYFNYCHHSNRNARKELREVRKALRPLRFLCELCG